MTPRAVPPLLLLSDVDGTLLGDDGTLPAPRGVLRAHLHQIAREWDGPFVFGLASSRTVRELTVLQRALGWPGPCIAEDGARYAVDEGDARARSADIAGAAFEVHGRRRLATWSHALDAGALRARTEDTPSIAAADAVRRSVPTLQALGFGTPGAMRRALAARTHSVLLDPSTWTAEELRQLHHTTTTRGLHLRRGGRWVTLTTAGGKGPALRALRHHFSAHGVSPVVAAIGNEENDESLLSEADCRFVMRNPHRGPHPVLSQLPGAVVLGIEGPGGWMEMLELLVPCARGVLAQRDIEASR